MQIPENIIKKIYDVHFEIEHGKIEPMYKIQYFYEWLLRDIDLNNTTICDVGVGKGFSSVLFSYFANKIISFEPSEGKGSSDDSYDKSNTFISQIDRKNISLIKKDFMKNDIPNHSIDIVFAINSIHHIIEINNKKDNLIGIIDRMVLVFEEFNRILKKNGKIIIWDSSRNCFWRYLPKSRMENIDWYLHPNLQEWKKAINALNFSYKINYTVPYKLRKINFLIDNYFINFLYNATFKITITK